jgi:hypothetical protein
LVSSLAVASDAAALMITLSTMSSDATPASQLDAVLEIEVGEFDAGSAGDELRLTLTNPSALDGGDALFNVSEVYWNAAANVSALTLLSATHSVAGDVTGAWTPVEVASPADGFGTFDFALTDGVGATNVAIAEPGESVVFVMAIAGTGPFAPADFLDGNSMGYVGAAKFVNGPDDPEAPGFEDSAFGTVPEPGAGLLMLVGLAGALADARRRH